MAGNPSAPTLFIAGDTHVEFVLPPLGTPLGPNCAFQHYQSQNALPTSCKLDIISGTMTGTFAAQPRFYSSAAILHTLAYPNRILRFGGSTGSYTTSNPLNVVEEWNDSQQVWLTKAPLVNARVFQNAVILPTGQVFIVGGTLNDYQNNGPNVNPIPVYTGEIYDIGAAPTSAGSAFLTPAAQVPRLYHSLAVLLPDGRIASLGGDDNAGAAAGSSGSNVEIYSPPYLFQANRPVINWVISSTSSAPYPTTYAQQVPVNITIPLGPLLEGFTPVTTAVLIRPGSATHHFDCDQRYIELIVTSGPGSLTVTMPQDATSAPPGYYMLFILYDSGSGPVPSVAATIHLT